MTATDDPPELPLWHWVLLAVVTTAIIGALYYADCGPLSCMPELIGPPLPPDYALRLAPVDFFHLHVPTPFEEDYP